MPIPLYPKIIPQPFAENGTKNDIPNTNNITLGDASYSDGFPPITALPIASGGIPPGREDFNGILYEISEHIYWQQSGGGYIWSNTLNYQQNSLIFGSDNLQYIAIQPSGIDIVGVGAINPVTDSANEYWKLSAQSTGGGGGVTDFLTSIVPIKFSIIPENWMIAAGQQILNWETTLPELWAVRNEPGFIERFIPYTSWLAEKTAKRSPNNQNVFLNQEGGQDKFGIDGANLWLPDCRNMHIGGVSTQNSIVAVCKGDTQRNIEGSWRTTSEISPSETGVVYRIVTGSSFISGNSAPVFGHNTIGINAARGVPTGPQNIPPTMYQNYITKVGKYIP